MGMETVTTTIEQRGGISTNPGGLSPDPSRPIEQVGSSSSSSEPMEQATVSTAKKGLDELSNPIEQHPDAVRLEVRRFRQRLPRRRGCRKRRRVVSECVVELSPDGRSAARPDRQPPPRQA